MNFKTTILLSKLFLSCVIFAQDASHKINKISQQGKSLYFDGIDDQIRARYSPLLNINNGTLEATIKIIDSTKLEWHPIISKQFAYQLSLYGYQLAAYDWKERKINSFGPELNNNQWHHIAFVFRDGVKNGSQFYLDGNAVGIPFTYNIFNQTGQVDIGSNNFWDQFFNGLIDEIRIWNKPLSLAEINKNATTEISKYSENLVAYYKFNDGIAGGNNMSILKFYDETSNKLHGYFFNFAFQGKVSNFNGESIIKPYNDNIIISFIIDKRWLIFWCVFALTGAFILYKFRIRYLVNQNKKLEKIVEHRTEQLAKMVDEKDVLIQEIHHRVKNNLQFILSIIDMQIMINVKTDNTALHDVSRRLTAMSLVHELLYRQENIERVSSIVYFNALVDNIQKLTASTNVVIRQNIHEINFTTSQCMSIGMILSELVSNSLKYAFVNQNYPEIQIILKQVNSENEMELIYKDNGIGFDNSNQKSGLGSTLINAFCQQLKGSYRYENTNAVLFILKFGM